MGKQYTKEVIQVMESLKEIEPEKFFTSFFTLLETAPDISFLDYKDEIDSFIREEKVEPFALYGVVDSLLGRDDPINFHMLALIVLQHVPVRELEVRNYEALCNLFYFGHLKGFIQNYIDQNKDEFKARILDEKLDEINRKEIVKFLVTAYCYDTERWDNSLEDLLPVLRQIVQTYLEKGEMYWEGGVLGLEVETTASKLYLSNPEKYANLIQYMSEFKFNDVNETIIYKFFHSDDREIHDLAVSVLKQWQGDGHVINDDRLIYNE